MKLKPHHLQILCRLAWRKEYDGPESGAEISKALGHARYWAGPKLNALAEAGLAEPLGITGTGGRCYRITPVGRAALEQP
jgi:DNA-binding MarR family transcriptional regulator